MGPAYLNFDRRGSTKDLIHNLGVIVPFRVLFKQVVVVKRGFRGENETTVTLEA